MVHSDVYLNKYVVSIAPFSINLPALIAVNIFRKLLFFAYFRFFNFSSVFPGGSAVRTACTYAYSITQSIQDSTQSTTVECRILRHLVFCARELNTRRPSSRMGGFNEMEALRRATKSSINSRGVTNDVVKC